MKFLMNYASGHFLDWQELNSLSGMHIGLFDKVISYAQEDIDRGFFEKNRGILTQPKGNGYWLWKPYFIQRTLERLEEGDFLFYCDAGAYFIASIEPLVELCRSSGQDVICFDVADAACGTHTAIEVAWTKRDAFILMKCESPQYTQSLQRQASFSLWRRSAFSVDLAREWLAYGQDERLITDLENQLGEPNDACFVAHRHDQSIFSLLTKKYEFEAYRDPSQWGNDVRERYPNSPYGQLIYHARGSKTVL